MRGRLRALVLPQQPKVHFPFARVIGPSSLRIRVHVGQQGHLRRDLFEQIVVDRRPGDVPTQGDKSDGERDVPVSRVGIECGSGDVEGI